ncbi:MAG: SGNH/GDSL hydrolase family protein [Jiangellaceae bacterium]
MWSSYVAIGDSFTEGMNDLRDDGSLRGWADRVATAMASEQPGFRYANLAVRGKLVHQIVADQIPRAIAMRPQLVSLFGGVNDLLRPRVDLDRVTGLVDAGVRDLRSAGIDVVLFLGGGPSRAAGSNGRGRIRARIVALNEAIARTALRYDCRVVDIGVPEVFVHPDMWSEDRLHMSSLGHERIAAAVCEALDVRHAGRESWRDPVEPTAPVPWVTARRSDLHWARTYLAPWVARRIRGRSSGDGRLPKRPELTGI